MENEPIFSITPKVLNLIVGISTKIGEINAVKPLKINPKLRKENRIRTIHSSLAIENNTLSLEQVTAILDGKRILGNPMEIKEVKNAADSYNLMFQLDPMNVDDLLKAHRLMTQGLIKENGRFRNGSVGVFDGENVIHVAPPAQFVPELISGLFDWYKSCETHPLIKSAVFHYEFEFIHPFSDGNGRMGRMWHTLLLGNWHEIFFWLPTEELIKERQQEYYDALNASDKTADSTKFIEVMLRIIFDSLKNFTYTDQVTDQVSDQVKLLLECIGQETLSANEIMKRLNLSHKPSFRKNYLLPALNRGLIEMTVPDKPNSRNQKYRQTNKNVI
ncbi:MAG: Fic family protein [Ruminococcus sp.]|nr:Fic family protein [Ruminococcus sp.]